MKTAFILLISLSFLTAITTTAAQELEVYTFKSIEEVQAWMTTEKGKTETYKVSEALQKSVQQKVWEEGEVRLHLMKKSKSAFFVSVREIIEENPYTGNPTSQRTSAGTSAATGIPQCGRSRSLRSSRRGRWTR